jgi:hypothetical protein
MKRQFTQKDSQDFSGAMKFLELMWGVVVDSQVDLDTGKGTVKVWLPGTETVLHLETVDVRHIRVIEREKQRFPDRGNEPPAAGTPHV